MIDFHTHTLLSDGRLLPAEQARRAAVAGYRALGLADHVDASTIGLVVPVLVSAARSESAEGGLRVVPCAELTHVRPEQIGRIVAEARRLGARIVLAHGETIAEPVAPGTNRAAIEAGVDILAHPGRISEADAEAAAGRGVYLEITCKAGHSLTNGCVAAMARKCGAKLVFGTDAHGPGDFATRRKAVDVLAGAGLDDSEIDGVFENMAAILREKG